mgnify:CR=1 FL=1
MKTTENTGNFADRLSDLISKAAQNGITLRDIERATGVKKESISKYQNNKAEPGLNSIVALAKYFNVSADYLLGLSDAATTDITVQEICKKTGLSEEMIVFLLEDDETYPAEHQKNVCDLVNTGTMTIEEARWLTRYFLNSLYEHEQFSHLCYIFWLVKRKIDLALTTEHLANIAKEELSGSRFGELSQNDFIKFKIYELEQILLKATHQMTKYDEFQENLKKAISIITTDSNYTKESLNIKDFTYYDDFLNEARNKMSHIIEDMLKGEGNGNSN